MHPVMTERPGDRAAGTEGGTGMDGSAGVELPELSFVHPIPGFAQLRRFVLVRLDDDECAAGAETPALIARPPVGDADAGLVAVETPVGAVLETDEVAKDGGVPAPDEAELYELRSLERPEVRFMVAAPNAFFSDYDIELDDEECGALGLSTPEEALVLVMLTVGQDASSSTANLLAPVVINSRTRAAAQVILTGSDWPVRAPLG
jgi:flagellar assembly factor FliW